MLKSSNNRDTLFGKLSIFSLIALTFTVSAGSRDPFPVGYSMTSQGAIVSTEEASGREPWVGAAFYRDTMRFGVSLAAIDYYGGGAAAQYAVGGFYVFDPIILKAALMQLDVMGIYYEQTTALSIGSSQRFTSFCFDAGIYRAGLYGVNDTRATVAVGAALFVHTRRINADIVAKNIALSSGGAAEIAPSASISLRVCTVRNRYGSQGAMIKITPSDDAPAKFAIAQEYRIGKLFAVSASIASNPTTIGFGIAIDKFSTGRQDVIGAAAAVANHPFLGWSKGIGVDYCR